MKTKINYLLTAVFLFASLGLNAQLRTCGVKSIFTYNRADSCKIMFTDGSVAAPGTSITSWHWNFGDGSSDSVQNPAHTYTADGYYFVCLTVTGVNAAGQVCRDRICQYIIIRGCNPPCRVRSSFSYLKDSCNKVLFSDSSRTGSGTSITSWHWDFGDGNTSSLQNPVHVYNADGYYTVCLTVTGVNAIGQPCKDTYCRVIKIKGCNPPCRIRPFFTYAKDSCKVTFYDSSRTGSGTTITSWHWDFGDGNTSSLQNPVHTYKAWGYYTICLTVTGVNATGQPCREKYCRTIRVECGLPCRVRSRFGYSKDSCNVTFSDSSQAGAGTSITSWHWSFGDGDTSNLQNTTHTYKTSGVYIACLTVKGLSSQGLACKNTTCHRVTVRGCLASPEPLKSTYSADPDATTFSSVYPNPVQSEVTVSFTLNKAEQVWIAVSDIQGREVAVIQNGSMQDGYQTLTWNVPDHVVTGLYIITVKTDTVIEEKRLMIQK